MMDFLPVQLWEKMVLLTDTSGETLCWGALRVCGRTHLAFQVWAPTGLILEGPQPLPAPTSHLSLLCFSVTSHPPKQYLPLPVLQVSVFYPGGSGRNLSRFPDSAGFTIHSAWSGKGWAGSRLLVDAFDQPYFMVALAHTGVPPGWFSGDDGRTRPRWPQLFLPLASLATKHLRWRTEFIVEGCQCLRVFGPLWEP